MTRSSYLSAVFSASTPRAIPFTAIHAAERNGKWWLTMNATKEAIKAAPGYKYDKAKANWIPA